MKKIPVAVFIFTNGHRLELDLSWWDIDTEKSNEGILIYYNKNGEMFSVNMMNVNWASTMIKTIPEIGDLPPLRKRLDPRNMQPFL